MTKAEIYALLDRSDEAVARALTAIYNHQTDSEKLAGRTQELNGIGFNAYDSEFLSSLAEYIIKGRQLTPKQLQYCRPQIKKYWKQLQQLAQLKARKEQGQLDL